MFSLLPSTCRVLRLSAWAWPLAVLALPSLAPFAAAAAPRDPTDAQAPVPPLRHDSALARYRGLQEGPLASWPAANERVRQVGGWRAYAREPVVDAPLPPRPTPSRPESRP